MTRLQTTLLMLTLLALTISYTQGCAGLFGGGGGGGGCCCSGGCGGGRRKRSIPDDEDPTVTQQFLRSSDSDLLCNSPEMKGLIRANMKSSPQLSSKSLQLALEDFDAHRYVVVCSENPFHYSIRHDSAFCGARNASHYCQAFAI